MYKHGYEPMMMLAGPSGSYSPMELAADTKHIAQYSPTSTPILDVLRPLPRKRDRLSAGEYFFLSSAVILMLIGLPALRQAAESISSISISIGMPLAFLVALLIIPGMALGAALAAHEAGHLLAAWMAGFQLAQRKFGKNAPAWKLYPCAVLRLSVVALEPQPLCARAIRAIYAGDDRVTLVEAATGEEALVAQGLDVGDAVIVDAPNDLRDGARIAVDK